MCAGLMLFGPVDSKCFKHLSAIRYIVGSWQRHLFLSVFLSYPQLIFKKKERKDRCFILIGKATSFSHSSCVQTGGFISAWTQPITCIWQTCTAASPALSWLFQRWRWLLVQLKWTWRDCEMSKNVSERWCFSTFNPLLFISCSLPERLAYMANVTRGVWRTGHSSSLQSGVLTFCLHSWAPGDLCWMEAKAVT